MTNQLTNSTGKTSVVFDDANSYRTKSEQVGGKTETLTYSKTNYENSGKVNLALLTKWKAVDKLQGLPGGVVKAVHHVFKSHGSDKPNYNLNRLASVLKVIDAKEPAKGSDAAPKAKIKNLMVPTQASLDSVGDALKVISTEQSKVSELALEIQKLEAEIDGGISFSGKKTKAKKRLPGVFSELKNNSKRALNKVDRLQALILKLKTGVPENDTQDLAGQLTALEGKLTRTAGEVLKGLAKSSLPHSAKMTTEQDNKLKIGLDTLYDTIASVGKAENLVAMIADVKKDADAGAAQLKSQKGDHADKPLQDKFIKIIASFEDRETLGTWLLDHEDHEDVALALATRELEQTDAFMKADDNGKKDQKELVKVTHEFNVAKRNLTQSLTRDVLIDAEVQAEKGLAKVDRLAAKIAKIELERQPKQADPKDQANNDAKQPDLPDQANNDAKPSKISDADKVLLTKLNSFKTALDAEVGKVLIELAKRSLPDGNKIEDKTKGLIGEALEALHQRLGGAGRAKDLVELMATLREAAESAIAKVEQKPVATDSKKVHAYFLDLTQSVAAGNAMDAWLMKDAKFDATRLALDTKDLEATEDYTSANDEGKKAQVETLKLKHELTNNKRDLALYLHEIADKKNKAKLVDTSTLQSASIDANLTSALHNLSSSDQNLDEETNLLLSKLRETQVKLQGQSNLDKLDDETFKKLCDIKSVVAEAREEWNKLDREDWVEDSLNETSQKNPPSSDPMTSAQLDELDKGFDEQDSFVGRRSLEEVGVPKDKGIDVVYLLETVLGRTLVDQSQTAELEEISALSAQDHDPVANEMDAEVVSSTLNDEEKAKIAWKTPITFKDFEKIQEYFHGRLDGTASEIEARHTRIKMGRLADYGINENAESKLLSGTDLKRIENKLGDDANNENAKQAMILEEEKDLLSKLAKSKLVSINQSKKSLKLLTDDVQSLASEPIVGKAKVIGGDSLAAKGIIAAQGDYSPAINSRLYALHVRQMISNMANTFFVKDVAFAQQAKIAIAIENTGLATSMTEIAEEMKELEHKLASVVDKEADKPENIEDNKQKFENNLKSHIEKELEWENKFNEYYQNPKKVRALVQAAVLEARPNGTDLRDYKPEEQLGKIRKKLKSWGIEPETVRPLLFKIMSEPIDRKRIDDWSAELDEVMPKELKNPPISKQMSDLIVAQGDELEPSGWMYLSSSHGGGVSASVTKKFLEFFKFKVQGDAALSKTAEIALAKTSDGISLTVYAGKGKSFSFTESLEVETPSLLGKEKSKKNLNGKARFHIGGSVSSTQGGAHATFNGFTFKFSSKDGKDPNVGLSRFLEGITREPDSKIEPLTLKDLTMASEISTFREGSISGTLSLGTSASASGGLNFDPVDISFKAGISADATVTKKSKTKDTKSTTTHTVDRLTMFQITRNLSVSAGGGVTYGKAPAIGKEADEAKFNVTGSAGKLGSAAGGDKTKNLGMSVNKSASKSAKGVIYGWSNISRNRISPKKEFEAASFGFIATSGGKKDPWTTLESVAKFAGCEGAVESWKDDDKFAEFREKWLAMNKQRSGSDYVTISMGLKPGVLSKANKLLSAGKGKEAEALIGDKSNYQPTGISLNPTQEWSASKSTSLLDAGLSAGGVGIGAGASLNRSAWGELSIQRNLEVPFQLKDVTDATEVASN